MGVLPWGPVVGSPPCTGLVVPKTLALPLAEQNAFFTPVWML